jgi:twitching motility protein PilU
MVGEVRDKETMQSALIHTLTGHLCLTTHPREQQLSRAVADHQPVSRTTRARPCCPTCRSAFARSSASASCATATASSSRPSRSCSTRRSIAELIKNGEFVQIKEAMEQSLYPGSQTFEQALCRLYLDGVDHVRRGDDRSDSPTNLAWLINQNSTSSRVDAMESTTREANKPARTSRR